MERKVKVYCAAGWFTPRTKEILDKLEYLLSNEECVNLYSPRRDGVMLTPNQKHDTSIRETVFKDNIHHIIESDLLVANIDSADAYNDPGTMYEIGYAMAHHIPVIGFTLSEGIPNIDKRFQGIKYGFTNIITSYDELHEYIKEYITQYDKKESKVLFVGAGDKDVDSKLATYIMDNGFNLRWINDTHDEIYSRIDEIFDNIEYMIAVVDDRKTLVSWMIGQAYARGIPVITYSDHNYGINVMLLVSILTHIRGTEELVRFLQQVKHQGLQSIPKFDISQLESM